jgi:hypothetical protein
VVVEAGVDGAAGVAEGVPAVELDGVLDGVAEFDEPEQPVAAASTSAVAAATYAGLSLVIGCLSGQGVVEGIADQTSRHTRASVSADAPAISRMRPRRYTPVHLRQR